MMTLKEQLAVIPPGKAYEGERYDTKDEHVLHLEDGDGNCYDLRVKKE